MIFEVGAMTKLDSEHVTTGTFQSQHRWLACRQPRISPRRSSALIDFMIPIIPFASPICSSTTSSLIALIALLMIHGLESFRALLDLQNVKLFAIYSRGNELMLIYFAFESRPI